MVPLKAAKETLAKTHHALSTHTSVVPQMAREWTRQKMKPTQDGDGSVSMENNILICLPKPTLKKKKLFRCILGKETAMFKLFYVKEASNGH